MGYIPNNVNTFNTRTGNVTPTPTDIINTGVVPSDIGAISSSGGGAEQIVIESSVSGTYTPDLTLGNYFVLNITGNTTINMPSVTDGMFYGFIVHIVQGGSGGYTFTWDAKITWISKVAPTMVTAVGDDDILSFLCEGNHLVWLGLHHTARIAIGGTYLDITGSAEPSNPASGSARVYYDNTLGKLIYKESDGTKHDLTSVSAPAAGSITLVAGQSTSTTAVGTSLSRTLASSPTQNNLLVAVFATESTGSITAPGTWSTAIEYAGTAGIGKVGIYYKIAGVAESATASFSISGSHFCALSLMEYTGNVTSTPVDKTASNEIANSASSVTATTAATTVAHELAIVGVLSAYAYNGAGSVSWSSSGFSTIYDSGNSAAGSKTLTSTGAVAATALIPNTNYVSVIVATFKAA